MGTGEAVGEAVEAESMEVMSVLVEDVEAALAMVCVLQV